MKKLFTKANLLAVLKWVLFFVLPAIGVVVIETIIRGNMSNAIHWILSYKKMALISMAIFFCVQLLLFAIFNNVYFAAFITFIVWTIAAIVNFYKVNMMGDPVLPWDFLYMNQLFDLLPALYKNVNLFALIGGLIVSIILIVVMIKFTNFKTFKWYIRIVIGIVAVIPFYFIYTYEDNRLNKVFAEAGMVNTPWNQIETQKKNGMMLGFIVNLPNIRVDKPEGYSKNELANVEKQVQSFVVNGEYKTSDITPNVVMIMSEAFWEVSNLGVTLNGASVNPTVDENKYGHIVSPRYGGGTSNVEFEAITGFSTVHLPGGSIPYQQYMGKDIPSLAWTFKERGYSTTAIHTYYKYFWNRIQAYESLGFEQFIGLDDIEKEAPFYGSLYVDDAVVTDQIMKTLKESEKPSFIYSVTMQNHGLYNDNRYGENQLKVVDKYSEGANNILNNLATGYNHSDQELARLFEELETLDEPTLVVFYGDHLPSMSEVYDETKYVNSMAAKSVEEELKMKQTPLVVWNNYGQVIEEVGNVSTSFLPPLVMKWSQQPSTGYYNLLEQMRISLPAYTSLVKQDAEGNLYQSTPEQYQQLEKMYQLVQYDMMFGEEYSEQALFK